MGNGTRNNPWTSKEVKKYALSGAKAVKAVEKLIGQKLTSGQKRVVEVEGYVPGFYDDGVGNLTYGVGQTGEWIDKGFVAAYEEHAKKAEDAIGALSSYPEELANEFVQLAYRGDIEKKHNWVAQFKRGEFGLAAGSLLVHREYLDKKNAGIDDGVTRRLEQASNLIGLYDGQKLNNTKLKMVEPAKNMQELWKGVK